MFSLSKKWLLLHYHRSTQDFRPPDRFEIGMYVVLYPPFLTTLIYNNGSRIDLKSPTSDIYSVLYLKEEVIQCTGHSEIRLSHLATSV